MAKRISPTEKMQGAGKNIFFEDNSELVADKEIAQDTIKETTQDNNKDSEYNSTKGTIQDTTQYTTKYTIETPVKSELFDERLVSNITKSQKKYVKTVAKSFENESAFVRFMIDYFRNNIDIKEVRK